MTPVGQWRGIILPVGHRLGELHDPSVPGPRRIVVRHGSTAELLTPEDTLVWEAAHSVGVGWAGAGAVARRLIGLGAQPEEAVPRLVARGLLVHVDPADDEALRVSATVRARPLGSATGGDPDESMGYGLPGGRPLTRLAGRDVEVWTAAVATGDLGRAAAALQTVWAGDLGREATPELARAALAGLWDVVEQMVSARAGYLDTAG